MGPCRRRPHPRPRRSRSRRGRGAGRLHDRARTLAARRDAGEPRRLGHHDRPEPGDRPAPPRADVRPQGRAARAAGVAPGRGGRRELDPRRPARARLHVLPPGARSRGAGRADAARGRGLDDDGDRAGVPRRRAGDGATARAREAKGARRRHPVPRAARPRAARAAPLGARRPLPRLQRGVLGDGRRGGRARIALRRGDPAREAPRGADAGRAGGARLALADAAARRQARRAHSSRRLDRAARGSGPLSLEPRADRRGDPRARARALPPATGELPAPGRDRGSARRGGRDGLVRRSLRSTTSSRDSSRRRSSS